MKQKLSIPKNYLMLIAGMLWIIAGAMVMKVGVPILTKLIVQGFWHLLFAIATFLVFYIFIFSKLVGKHTNRIKSKKNDRLPFWEFFDVPSYIVMIIMMTGGMWLRTSHLIPDNIIGPFYSGLGFALFSCGVRFISVFLRKKVVS
ncbi:hypothetical protein SAMN05216497_10789 [Clostridium cochlearium]|uniref:Uncharacterized protein n=1 Tax=Clostridium cochlearium TaxID=1494 RepID=A0ABY0QL15_CLOCO|nr:hypothetical protein [Clostridium cochlearium]SDL11435.1 hypothetical protein SAMN05216497_10789 [Clostridium cochlearium]